VDLKSQFEAMQKISMQATVYSEDEFGGLASSFNEMARVISRTTLAQRKASRAGASQRRTAASGNPAAG